MKRKQILVPLILLGFLLGIHQGRVALWKDGQSDPCKVFPCPVSVLPADVQQALESGIRIESESELDRLLESFCS